MTAITILEDFREDLMAFLSILLIKKNVSKEYVLVSTFFNRCEKFGMKEVNVELSIPISIMSLSFISWTQPAHLICNSLDLDGTPRQASNNVMP